MATWYLNESAINLPLPAATLALASGAYVQTRYVDNTRSRERDVLIQGGLQTGATPTVNQNVVIYGYASLDGTHFSGGATGVAGLYTPVGNNNLLLKPLDTIVLPATANQDYSFGPFSFITKMGLTILPPYWGVIIYNISGAALNATGTNNYLVYRSVVYA